MAEPGLFREKEELLTVDSSKGASVRSSDIIKDNVTLEHVVAVAAGSVELAKGLDGEAGDGECAAAVVLQDFVIGAIGSAAGDGGCLASVLFLDGECVLADGGPPDVGESAGAEAVDAFGLVGAYFLSELVACMLNCLLG